MASKGSFNNHPTCCESFLALSVVVRVNKHQLEMESHVDRAPVFHYGDIFASSELLKQSLAHVCLPLGVHSVGRVRQENNIPLFEVDFSEQKHLEMFCKSLNARTVDTTLRCLLGVQLFPGQELEVTVKLHLIMPNADKKDPQFREVTLDNYEGFFTIIKESALDLTHSIPPNEETDREELDIEDIGELLEDLIEVAACWFIVGLLLRVPYHELKAIQKDNRDQSKECLREMLATWLKGSRASPAALVNALRAAGHFVLANKFAVKHGMPESSVSNTDAGDETDATSLIQFFSIMADKPSSAQSVQTDVLKTLAVLRQGLVTTEDKYSKLTQQLDDLQKKEKEVNQSLEETKSSLEIVKDQINQMKSQQESLIREQEEKQSQKEWLIKQKGSNFGDNLTVVEQLIEGTEKAINELIEKITELEVKIRSLGEEREQTKTQLTKQKKDKEELLQKLEKVQKEKESLETTLNEDRRSYQREIARMMFELELQENQMEMMQEELSHRREEVKIALTRIHSASENLNAASVSLTERQRESSEDDSEASSEDDQQSSSSSEEELLPFGEEELLPSEEEYTLSSEAEDTLSSGEEDHSSVKALDQPPSPTGLPANFGAFNKWVIPWDEICCTKGATNPKMGFFGEVFRATLKSTKKKVAVKMCNSKDTDEFFYEAAILKGFKHRNIVRLIGVVTKSSPLCIVLELLPYGTFRHFLRKKDSIMPTKKLMLMCTDVCAGMEYLESKYCIHRTLAACNCLVGKNDVVKISNFRMSMKVEGGNEVTPKSELNFNKRTAPEVLKYGMYTSASDVWTFGILLWEVFAFGKAPYKGISFQKARRKVEKGYRMPPPPNCPETVYCLMQKCWQYSEVERPTFADLHAMLKVGCKEISS